MLLCYSQSQIDAAFRKFDRDNKGYVTVHDAKAIMRNFGFSDFEIEGLVRIHDKNRDGKLQYNEFTSFWTGSAGQLAPGATPAHVIGQSGVAYAPPPQSYGQPPQAVPQVQPSVAIGSSQRYLYINFFSCNILKP